MNGNTDTLFKRESSFTVELGTLSSPTQALWDLNNDGFKMSHRAEGVVQATEFRLLGVATTYDFVEATVAEVIGDRCKVTTRELLDSVTDLGFLLGPPESALAIRRRHAYQRINEYLIVVTQPLIDMLGKPRMLEVRNVKDEQWVFGRCAEDQEIWSPYFRLLLCRKL